MGKAIKISGLIILGLLMVVKIQAQQSTNPDCSRKAGSLPFKRRAPGTRDGSSPIQHILVLMQENHSFDTYFGRLNQPQFYGAQIDGMTDQMFNPNANGSKVFAHHESSLCVQDPEHTWDAIHQEWDGGAQDGFVKINGEKSMGYFDQNDIPFYYDLANKFAVADRYFCSSLTQTLPNRFYLYAGTSFGHVSNDVPLPIIQFAQKTIFNELNDYKISWKYYRDGPGYLAFFQPMFLANQNKMASVADFAKDAQLGNLPEVIFLDSSSQGEDEHPNANIQVGQSFVAHRIQELTNSPAWQSSVLFLTYDEGGGFYDHVDPPAACVPDDKVPILTASSQRGLFNNLGFRVPFVAVSPYAKHHFVSHKVYDHTSILRFIENMYNLPALTNRDANANSLDEMLDYRQPDFDIKPDATLAQVSSGCP